MDKNKIIITFIFIFSFFCIFFGSATGSSFSNAVKGLQVEQLQTAEEIQAALVVLQAGCRESIDKQVFPFELQKSILTKSGECISKVVLLQHSLPDAPRKISRLFELNRSLLKDIIAFNRDSISALQENVLDQLENQQDFFLSDQWQHPQHCISLSRYWLSWNNYYYAQALPEDDNLRSTLLDEAVDGFSRSYLDFEDQPITIKSLLGRALTFRDLGFIDKADRDLHSVISKTTPDDSIHVRSRYEQASLNAKRGNLKTAMQQLEKMRTEIPQTFISEKLQLACRKLRAKIHITELQQTESSDPAVLRKKYHAVLLELKALVKRDRNQADELYRFVSENIERFIHYPFQEIGPSANLAIGDYYFKAGLYPKAIPRYEYLLDQRSILSKNRMDELYFRLGYCSGKTQQWRQAQIFFETLFNAYPNSTYVGKAACLSYVTAAKEYKESPLSNTYTNYIESAQRYLAHCPDPKDAGEVHFQLAKYYQSNKQESAALNHFLQVGIDSDNYPEACYWILKYNINKIELQSRSGTVSRDNTTFYHNTCALLDQYRELMKNNQKTTAAAGLSDHIDIFQAKLLMYGHDKNYSKALGILNNISNNTSANTTNNDFALIISDLRLTCLRESGNMVEAEQIAVRLLDITPFQRDCFKLLQQYADKLWNDTLSHRTAKQNNMADASAELAIIIYSRLAERAAADSRFTKQDQPIRLKLAKLYYSEQRLSEAKPILQAILSEHPQSGDALYNLGLICEAERDWPQALELWRTLADGVKTGSFNWYEARYHLAIALSSLEQREHACTIMTMTHVLHPELRDKQFREKFIQLKNTVCTDSTTKQQARHDNNDT